MDDSKREKMTYCMGCGFSEVMGVYRHHEGGWTQTRRTESEVWKIINNNLDYKIYGKEYDQYADYFYQRDCIGVFFSYLRHGKLKIRFFQASLKVSLRGDYKSYIQNT